MFSRIAILVSVLVPVAALAVPPLSTPWPCDVSYRITQGHNTGSHTDKGAWAWDIGVPENADVTAPADGVVRAIRMDSSRGGCDSAFANDANYVVIDFGDGTEALLLHLAPGSSSLKVGDRVKRGEVVGRVGLTGWVCGAHLHFQIQQTCSSWWCQSIPADFEAYGNPTSGSYVSDNCPSCGAVASLETPVVVDEKDPGCFKRRTTYWWSVNEGEGGHHYYTFGTDGAAADTQGVWTFDVAQDGDYAVDVFIPSTEADSTNASYVVFDGANASAVSLDQSAQKGWIPLGSFAMTAGEQRSVTLGDNTGEPYDLRRKLAYDAIRVSAVPQTPTMPGEDDMPVVGDPTTPDNPADPQDPVFR
ncbi:MAG: peptidoglycan DD-metalloendopeptidase family protein [bacterium]